MLASIFSHLTKFSYATALNVSITQYKEAIADNNPRLKGGERPCDGNRITATKTAVENFDERSDLTYSS